MATITTDTYLDGGTARTAGEAWTCNGGKLTIRTDTRWHANAPASMTGSLGATTVSATLGGGVLYEGRNVRWMPYNTGTGNVPAIGTTVSQGGVSGYLLGVWDTLTSAPTAVGAAMPADGFIKFREVTGGAFASGALTGIGASATGPDVTGWIEIVKDQSTVETISRKGLGHVARGDWFYLDDTTGTLGQVLQVPTNGGGATTYVPGVWVETAPSSDEYEYWPALTSARNNGWGIPSLGAAEGHTDLRQHFVKGLGTGQMQFGETLTQASTYASVSQASAYTWAADLLTVTFTAHGLLAGEQVYLDFTTGGATALDGVYTIETVTGANNYTVALAGSGASGNVTVVAKTTVTFTAHGMLPGQEIYVDATSGTLPDGYYEICTGTAANTYSIPTPIAPGATGNCTVRMTVGNVPVSGCKTRVPNIFLRQCTTGARATNAGPHSTIGSRPTFTTTGAGAVDHENTYGDWYYNFSQPYSVRLRHVASFESVAISECATAIDMLDGGLSHDSGASNVALVLTSCFAGGTIEGWKFYRATSAANGHAVNITTCTGQTFIDCIAGVIAIPRNSGNAWNMITSKGLTLTGCQSVNGMVTMTTCADITITDFDSTDRLIGKQASSNAIYTFTVTTKCSNVMIDGITEGFGGVIERQHAYNGFLTVITSDNVTMRNAGTRAAPLGTDCIHQRGVVYASGGNNSGIRIQRCYVVAVRSALITDTNSDKGVIYESVSAPVLQSRLVYTLTLSSLNAVVKGVKAPLPVLAANASVYGTHWWDMFTAVRPLYATYTWASDLITVSFTAHGLVPGDKVYLDFTSGGATGLDGVYSVETATSANAFKVRSSGSGTAGIVRAWKYVTTTPSDNYTGQGRLHLPMNEATVETADYVTVTGTAQFTSVPSLTIPADGDNVVIESQHTIVGHSAFMASPPLVTGLTTMVLANTYTWSASVVTVTSVAHAMRVGHKVYLHFTSGGGTPNGIYTIVSVPTANTFTVALTGSGTSGNVSVYRFIEIDYQIDTGAGYPGTWSNLYRPKPGCATTASSATVTMHDTTGLVAGDYVYEAVTTTVGVAGQSQIQSVDSSTQITLTTAAVGTVSNRALIFSHLPAETISPSTGFRIKARIGSSTPGSAMVLTYLTIPTITSATDQDNLYALDSIPASLSLTGLKVNTEVRVYRTSDDVELAGVEDSGTSFAYNYTWTGADIGVYVVIHALGYLPIRYEGLTLGQNGLTLPIQQQIDRQYLNP